jgi:hypothetical protein
LNSIEKFTNDNQLRINETKSKILIFNKSRNYDFPPECSFSNGDNLVLKEVHFLGVVLTTYLWWGANTSSIYSKAMGKMWLLRRMTLVKLEPQIVFDYYLKEIILGEQTCEH